MKKDIENQLLIELLGATLELENLKPFFEYKQLEASNNIREHLRIIGEILRNNSEVKETPMKHEGNWYMDER